MNPSTFTFIPAPTITAFTPGSGVAGTVVTITGTNFTGATAVAFGGTAATAFTVNSATSISATVGSGTTGALSVTTPGGTATSTGSFQVIHPPVAANDAYTLNENTTLNSSAPGVLANDSDVDGNTLTAVLQTSTSYGTLTFHPDGSFTYIPWSCFVGTDTFTYQDYDGVLYSSTATVTLTVNPVGYEGDVAPLPNGDGLITLADWVQEGRYVIGLDPIPTYPNSIFMAADCAPLAGKGDGKLTITDWVQVGRFALGLDPLATIGGPASLTSRTQALSCRGAR